MNMNYVRNGMWYGSRALFVASAVLVVLTVTKVSGYMTSSGRITKTVKMAKAQNGHDEETVKNLLAKGREVADQLKKKNMFVSPPPKPNPPVCFGIIGSSAIINGKEYKAGDNVAGAEIISVGTKEVVIKWDDNEMKLIPFAVNNASPPSRKPSSGGGEKKPEPGSTPMEVKVEITGFGPGMRPGGPGGGGGFMGMSSEDRQRMIDRYRNMSHEEQDRFREERRQQVEGEGGGSRGGDSRGGDSRGRGR